LGSDHINVSYLTVNATVANSKDTLLALKSAFLSPKPRT